VLGLYRSLSLPMQLPDFIVFDSGLAPSAGQQILAEGKALAAGYFDRDWNLPGDVSDRIAVPAGLDGARYRPPPVSARPRAEAATPPPP